MLERRGKHSIGPLGWITIALAGAVAGILATRWLNSRSSAPFEALAEGRRNDQGTDEAIKIRDLKQVDLESAQAADESRSPATTSIQAPPPSETGSSLGPEELALQATRLEQLERIRNEFEVIVRAGSGDLEVGLALLQLSILVQLDSRRDYGPVGDQGTHLKVNGSEGYAFVSGRRKYYASYREFPLLQELFDTRKREQEASSALSLTERMSRSIALTDTQRQRVVEQYSRAVELITSIPIPDPKPRR